MSVNEDFGSAVSTPSTSRQTDGGDQLTADDSNSQNPHTSDISSRTTRAVRNDVAPVEVPGEVEDSREILDLLQLATDLEEAIDRRTRSLNINEQSSNISPNTRSLESNIVDPSKCSEESETMRSRISSRPRGCSMQRRFTQKNTSKPTCMSYCACPKAGRELECKCGEEDNVFDWVWDSKAKSEACELADDNCTVKFHTNYSSGTAAIRGTQPMVGGQYFWEIKMNSPVYGTDMMVGIGTESMSLESYKHSFTSILGREGDSWGLSYYGRLQQKGQFRPISGGKFTQGSIVGVHADMWRGILTFYINRKPLAEKCYGLQGKTVYPMVSSTAARTSMKIIKASSFKTSLQFLCCQALRRIIPCNMDVLTAVELPPGLRAFLANNLSWLFRPSELSRSALRAAKKRKLHEEYGTSEKFHSMSKRKKSLNYFDDSDTSTSSFSDDELPISSQAHSLFRRRVPSDSDQGMVSETEL